MTALISCLHCLLYRLSAVEWSADLSRRWCAGERQSHPRILQLPGPISERDHDVPKGISLYRWRSYRESVHELPGT